ncbi:MAG TPA: MerC domain-containing protein [Enhygromyxa sp.]|nr:MerC domain-containing protein [Enhygromyxa sp.]
MATPHHTVDRVGSWLSLACALHCAVVPAAVLLAALGFPVVGSLGLFDDPRFELGFSLAAVIFVAASLGLGVRGGAERRPMVVGFAIGLALLGGSRLLPGPEWFGHLVLVAGALTIAFTHRRSLRSRSCCDPELLGPEPARPHAEGRVRATSEQRGSDPTPASAPLLP